MSVFIKESSGFLNTKIVRKHKGRDKTAMLVVLIFMSLWISSTHSQDIKGLMMQADELYFKREDLSKAKEAYLKYEDIIRIDPKNFDAHWKLARTIWYIGDFSPEMKKEEKISMFEKGIEVAKKAIEIAPKRAEGYFWLGVMYGLYGETRGVLRSLFLVDDIEKVLNESLTIDSTVEGGGAYRVLGRMYYKLPGFAGGSNKKSLEYLLRSKAICPTAPLTYIYLADTYLALKNKEMAKQILKEFIDMSPDHRWIPETKRYKKDAEEMLKRIK